MIPTARILLQPAEPTDTMETAAVALLAQVGLTLTDVWLTSDDVRYNHPLRQLGPGASARPPRLANLPALPGEGARVDFRRSIIEASDIADSKKANASRSTTTPRSAVGAKTKAASCAQANDKNTAT